MCMSLLVDLSSSNMAKIHVGESDFFIRSLKLAANRQPTANVKLVKKKRARRNGRKFPIE